MHVFVGLGNPGAQHVNTRHSLGFKILDQIYTDFRFPPWKSKFDGLISLGSIEQQKVLLLKPQTFVNYSGRSVFKVLNFYKLIPGCVTVFHDDIDLAPGKIKLKVGGSSAGHRGLLSLDHFLGPDYGRVRIGIGRPESKAQVTSYVLQKFSEEDLLWLPNSIAVAIELMLSNILYVKY